jgi:hypothetical protein
MMNPKPGACFMANIKTLDASAAKWQRVAQSAGPSYEEGINNPKADYATQAAAAEPNYEKGIQAALARKAYGKGVKRAGTATWKAGALSKGVTRWPQGIAAAGDNYKNGFQPYFNVIKNTTLPARGPKGDPANINRVSVMSKALHDEKVRRQSAG